jgi:hypothetical protein
MLRGRLGSIAGVGVEGMEGDTSLEGPYEAVGVATFAAVHRGREYRRIPRSGNNTPIAVGYR